MERNLRQYILNNPIHVMNETKIYETSWNFNVLGYW